MEKKKTVYLRRGLSRSQVIELMGQPVRDEKNGDLEVLHFAGGGSANAPTTRYYVVIGTNGRVESFGPDYGR